MGSRPCARWWPGCPRICRPVLVVLHVPREAPSALPRILDRAGPLPARVAVDGEPLTAGRIYVAPADHTCSCWAGGCGSAAARRRTVTGRRSTRSSDPPRAGTATVYGCPACGGGLYEVESNPLPRFRCRVGHAWSPESLLDEQAVATESALWMALRALEEKSALSRRMAGTVADAPGRPRLLGLAEDADTAGALIRDLLSRLTGRLAPEEQ